MSKPVEPLVCNADNAYPFRVLPSQRNDPAGTVRQVEMVPGEVSACRDELNQGLVTLDRTLRVRVKELLYPGKSSVWVSGKWIYVLKDGSYVAEIHAVKEQAWELLLNPNPDTPNQKRVLRQSSPGFVILDPGPQASPYPYDFFITPVRLPPKALRFLRDNIAESGVSRTFARTVEAIVEVPDPFHWSADAHNEYYIPFLDKWQRWVTDPDAQAKVFIGGVLQALLKDNQTKVKSHLKAGEPDAWLDSYTRREFELREVAEEAMAYLAHCVDSVEHHTVEMAGMESGGDDLGCCYLQWAVISERATQVLPGRVFIANAVGNPDRLPARFLFADNPPAGQLHFEDYRYAWLAALAAFENLVPAKFREFAVNKIPPLDRIKQYLAGLDLKTRTAKLVGKQKTIARNIRKGKPLTTGFGPSSGATRRFNDSYNGLLAEATREAVETAEKKAGKVSKFIDEIHAEYKSTVFAAKMTLGTVIEVVNVSSAIYDYTEAHGDEKGFHLTGQSKARNVVGTVADLSLHVASVTEELMEEIGVAGQRFLKGFGGFAGIISGVVDMENFEEGMVNDGLATNDYSVAVGKSFSALGSAGLVFMAALSLAVAIAPGSLPTFVGCGSLALLGPFGLIAGVIFQTLVIGGCLISAFFAENPYQQFAGACCFGRDHGEDSWYFPWAPGPMGQGRPVGESKVLLCLLSAFQVTSRVSIETPSSFMHIRPGHLNDNSSFEVKLMNRYFGVGEGTPLCYNVKVHLDSDDVEQVDGPYPLYPNSTIKRNSDGDVETITICVDEQYPGEYGVGSLIRMTAWIRMRDVENALFHPANANWVKMDIIGDHNGISSLDQSKIDTAEDPLKS